MVITEYARSWENRELILAVVSAPENIANLDAIKSNMQRLADPRITDEDVAAQIIESQAAVTWLSYGVHGNEISSTDAAQANTEHLGLEAILLEADRTRTEKSAAAAEARLLVDEALLQLSNTLDIASEYS